MRLIDANKVDFNKVFVGASEFAQDTRNAAQMLIDAQPTAYNVDKVVEKLEEYSNADEAERHGTIPVIELDDAIEIVKRGVENAHQRL